MVNVIKCLILLGWLSPILSHAKSIECNYKSDVRTQEFKFDSTIPEMTLKSQVVGAKEAQIITFLSTEMVCNQPTKFAGNCAMVEDPNLAKTIGAQLLFSFSCNNGLGGNLTFERGNVVIVECGRGLRRYIGNCRITE